MATGTYSICKVWQITSNYMVIVQAQGLIKLVTKGYMQYVSVSFAPDGPTPDDSTSSFPLNTPNGS
jgi:hypothetical protein